ncbi:LOW QUALITY PROTEIN: 39S ribosomal protein L16, mitochondrial, partial [Galemys pyrenaicus]
GKIPKGMGTPQGQNGSWPRGPKPLRNSSSEARLLPLPSGLRPGDRRRDRFRRSRRGPAQLPTALSYSRGGPRRAWGHVAAADSRQRAAPAGPPGRSPRPLKTAPVRPAPQPGVSETDSAGGGWLGAALARRPRGSCSGSQRVGSAPENPGWPFGGGSGRLRPGSGSPPSPVIRTPLAQGNPDEAASVRRVTDLVLQMRGPPRPPVPASRRCSRCRLSTQRPNEVPTLAQQMSEELPPHPQPPLSPTNVSIPERPKLRFVERVPLVPKIRREHKNLRDIQGPSTEATEFTEGNFAILALGGGYLHWGHFEMIRLTINRSMDPKSMFALWRVPAPFKPITRKGVGQRMGGGKGAIDHYVTPVKAGRLVVELGGHCEFKEVQGFLNQVAHKLPFRAKAMSRETLEKMRKEQEERERNNQNPWTFERIASANMLGIRKVLSPYDLTQKGRYWGKFYLPERV